MTHTNTTPGDVPSDPTSIHPSPTDSAVRPVDPTSLDKTFDHPAHDGPQAFDPGRFDPSHFDPMSALTDTAAMQAHPRLREWYGEERLRANLAAGLEGPVGWIGDEAFGTGYRDGVAVIDVPDPSAWANRHLSLPDGSWAVTGIRFRQRDLAKPFVEIVGTSLPSPDADTTADDSWTSLAGAVREAYAPFRPGKMQLFAAHPDRAIEAFARLGWHAEVDMWLVAGEVTELRARPRAARFDDVTLTAISPEQASTFAENAYRDLAAETPASALWAVPQSLDEFTDYGAAGMLFGIHVDGRLAGVVATAHRGEHGLTGFSVEELVIDAEHRGRRLAAPVLQHLLDRLPADDGDVLWGTIHPDNHASLRNALGIGREIVGADLWVTPAGWPGWDRQD